MAAPVTVLRKFQGCLVGGVVGDCIGAVFEGYDWSQAIGISRVLKLINAFEDGQASGEDNSAKKSRRYYSFTDDTAMARSVVKSLIEHNRLNVTDMARRFTEEFMRERNRGYGGSVETVFEALKENDYKDVFGPAQAQFEGQGSYGNGGAMRIAPAGLFAHKKNMSFDELKLLVENITRITHSHTQAVHGAILQAYAVQLALRTTSLDISLFLEELIQKLQPLEEEAFQKKEKQERERQENDSKKKMEGEENKDENGTEVADKAEAPRHPYCAKLAAIRDLAVRSPMPDAHEIRDTLGVYISALDAVPAAIYCFLRAMKDIEELEGRNAFERTIIYAVSLGGDTDTVATMAGSIAGAHYGLDLVPESWALCCEGRKDAMADAERLLSLT